MEKNMNEKDKRVELLENKEFFEWLLEATRRQDVSVNPNNKDTGMNLQQISLLFKVIDDYAKRNYIVPLQDGSNITGYNIHFGTEYLQVKEFNFSSQVYYSCSNVTGFAKILDNVLEFDDIKEYLKDNQENTFIDLTHRLVDDINTLLDQGVSREYLMYLSKRIITDYYVKQKSMKKTLGNS